MLSITFHLVLVHVGITVFDSKTITWFFLADCIGLVNIFENSYVLFIWPKSSNFCDFSQNVLKDWIETKLPAYVKEFLRTSEGNKLI